MRAEGGDLLLRPSCTARNFGTIETDEPDISSQSLLQRLNIGFVVATTFSYSRYKNSPWFRPVMETGSPYDSKYSTASNWMHLEMITPIINLTYEGDLTLWSSFPNSPRYTKTNVNFFSIIPLTGMHQSSFMLAMMLPSTTHSILSTRDYSKNIWDVSCLFVFEWKKTTETFLPSNGTAPYRTVSNQYYYLTMSNYLLWMYDFSRYMQVFSIMSGYHYDGLSLGVHVPLPFCNMYYETYSIEVLKGDVWQQTNYDKSPFNLEFGFLFSSDIVISDRFLIHPHMNWTLVPCNQFDAYLSFQYVF